jgi:hypothetical protein
MADADIDGLFVISSPSGRISHQILVSPTLFFAKGVRLTQQLTLALATSSRTDVEQPAASGQGFLAARE